MTLLIGFALLLAAIILGWSSGIGRGSVPTNTTTTDGTSRKFLTMAAWMCIVAGSIVFVIAGAIAITNSSSTVTNLPDRFGSEALRSDPLSGLFLIITFSIAIPGLVAAYGAARRLGRPRRRLVATLALVLLAVGLVETSGNFFFLYAGWEGVGLSFYLAVGYDRDKTGRQTAATMTAGFSKVSGAAVMLGGLLLVAQSHSFTLDSFRHLPAGVAKDAAYALLLLGFAIKVGMAPVHIWLPRAYHAAPPAARAILAGAAVNVGFYGMWRTLNLLTVPPLWLPCILLVLAGATAVLGIAHATVHARLAVLIAWSSVENAGLILAGFGVALVGEYAHQPDLVAVGLLAATLQVCAHALGKSLLFVSTTGIENAYRTSDLDQLRGIAGRLPASGSGALIGGLTLAGIPLTAGFASEWFIIESLMQEFRVHVLALNLTLATAGVLVALTIGIASVAFVRVIGLTVFGPPTALPASRRREIERSLPHRGAVIALIIGCLGTAIVAPLEVTFIAHGLAPIVGDRTFSAVTGSVVLQPIYSGFSSISPTWLWVVIPGYTLLLGAGTILVSRGRLLKVRRVPAWRSASPGVRGGRGYTSFAFANPLRRVLGNILLTRHELRREESEGDIPSHEIGTRGLRLGYTIDVVDVVERYLYRPLLGPAEKIVHTAKKLQSGHLDAYMAYMLIALIAVLAVITALPQH